VHFFFEFFIPFYLVGTELKNFFITPENARGDGSMANVIEEGLQDCVDCWDLVQPVWSHHDNERAVIVADACFNYGANLTRNFL
jgi:hypothetical protein